MSTFSAKNARVMLGANTFLNAMKWTINTKVDEVDTSNMEGGGYAEYIGGLWEADLSCDAFWDSVQQPFNNAPTLIPGNIIGNGSVGDLATIKFYLANTGVATAGLNLTVAPLALANFWSFSRLLITAVNMDTEVRGAVRFTFNARATGPWSMP